MFYCAAVFIFSLSTPHIDLLNTYVCFQPLFYIIMMIVCLHIMKTQHLRS